MTCLSCMENLQVSADGNSCEFENCLNWTVYDEHFDKLDHAQCLTCAEGFGFWSTTSTCEPCDSYFGEIDWTDCQNCLIDESGVAFQCLECDEDKTLIEDDGSTDVYKVCDYIPIENCEEQDRQECVRCQEGLYYDEYQGECLSCDIDGCLECEFDWFEEVTQCLKCEDEMYLTRVILNHVEDWWTQVQQVCAVPGELENCLIHNKHNRSECEVCLENAFLDVDTKECILCSEFLPNCHLCDSFGLECNVCSEGFELLPDGSCFSPHCLRSDHVSGECIECEEGFSHVWDLPRENCYHPALFAEEPLYDYNPLINTFIKFC